MNTLKNLILSNEDENLFCEVKAYKKKLSSGKKDTPIWERKWLTIEEAAVYSGIGRGKLRELANKAGCPFAIWMGNKIHIVREKLDKYTESHDRV
ncbi:excisionase [Ligilactobacillus murinus]|jgi:excisionase family DNA binding protein|uniref:excisionase n=1 Tax=Ligilactobacillus murinus TaxID=1622 RepID=UPI00214C8A0A|nr:excisionase [Ligilactobacillus murinus]MCR1881184.1 excisionase [Ligilactobacillus murinus]